MSDANYDSWEVHVDPVCQYPALPTGCEATSLYLLINWAQSNTFSVSASHLWSSVHLTKEIVAESLPKEPNPHDIISPEGTAMRCGGDPYRAFIGEPTDADSFGTFHGVIFNSLLSVFSSNAVDLTSPTLSWEDAESFLKRNQVPGVVWVSIDFKPLTIVDEWVVLGPNSSPLRPEEPRRTIQWKSPEHCLLITGSTPTHIIVVDPHLGRRNEVSRELFIDRWIELGRQLVTLKRE